MVPGIVKQVSDVTHSQSNKHVEHYNAYNCQEQQVDNQRW